MEDSDWEYNVFCGGLCLVMASFHFKTPMQYTSFELVIVGFCYVGGFILGEYHRKLPYVGYPLYLISKLVVSFVFFLLELAFWKPTMRLKRIRYLLGFDSNYVHAGQLLGKQFFRLSIVQTSANKIDNDRIEKSSKLERNTKKKAPNAFSNRIIGVSSMENSNSDQSTLLQTLNSSGKCHNWTAAAVYYLSLDTFLSHAIVMHLRGTTWITICFAVVCTFILKMNTSDVGKIMEISLLVVGDLDALNLRADKLKLSPSKKAWLTSPFRRRRLEFLKFLAIFAIPLPVIYFDISFPKWVEYVGFVGLSYAFGVIVHYLLLEGEDVLVSATTGDVSSELDSKKKKTR